MNDPEMPGRAEPAEQWHVGRSRALDSLAAREAKRSQRLANLRFALFIAIVVVLAVAEAGTIGELGVWLAAVPTVAFVAAVVAHQRTRERQSRFECGSAVHQDAMHRVRRDWDHLSVVPHATPDNHPYANDLDIAGRASIIHLLSNVRTPAGRALMQTWLLQGEGRDTIVGRQAAVTDLAERRVLREQIEMAGRMHVRPAARSHSDLRAWLGATPWLLPRRTLIWYARGATWVTVLLLGAHLSGAVPYALWLFPLIVNFAVSRAIMGTVHPILDQATSGEGALVAYEHILRHFSPEQFAAGRLRELQTRVRGDTWTASDAIAHFRRLASLAEVRRSFVAPILQAMMMWDIFALRRLEAWRDRWREYARSWFDVAAEIEVLNAFGGLLDDHPSWSLPRFSEGADQAIVAVGIGHPLLPGGVCVTNDVTIGPKGTFVFVTGSNMSGKSTLLRAVGCNVVLAQAGGPVCCADLTLPVVRLHTNMRVSDSLATGESYYLAALRRLKVVIDAAREAQPPEPPVLYLLDEILQGTNSAERKIAVQGVVRELLGSHAIGAITSHDLSLIDETDLESVAHCVHFTESVADDVRGAVMTFDYKLRSGIAPTRNALRLMEIIGLRLPSREIDDLRFDS